MSKRKLYTVAIITSAIIIFFVTFPELKIKTAEKPVPFQKLLKVDQKTMAMWVRRMKNLSRGPFSRIRWFCRDGTILEPGPYACSKHGGGVQHGEWTLEIKSMRAEGYLLANILVKVDPVKLTTTNKGHRELTQILLEKFLIAIDDGWIFRQARHYRGSLHDESENKAARKILLDLLDNTNSGIRNYLLLRSAVRWLPHTTTTPLVTDIRQMSTELFKNDPSFEPLRNKLHTLPDARDAKRVRDYAEKYRVALNSSQYSELAGKIDKLYKSDDIDERLPGLFDLLENHEQVSKPHKKKIQKSKKALTKRKNNEKRFIAYSQLLAYLRHYLKLFGNSTEQLSVLDHSLAIERSTFATGTALLQKLGYTSKRKRLRWLAASNNALYGIGLLTQRQYNEVDETIVRLSKGRVSFADYRKELRYLSRVPAWAHRRMRFHYAQSINVLTRIEPKAQIFIPEQLRGSVLLVYTSVLDSLVKDADRRAGVSNNLFGTSVGMGLRALNPGVARGVLRIPGKNESPESFKADGIYLLPATTEKLSRVAGILTLGEGNALSHVQLLAANLGIPNVVVDRKLLSSFQANVGKRVVLIVKPDGSVQLEADGPQWDTVFKKVRTKKDSVIKPNLHKLNLSQRHLLRLKQLRASDSGRIAGPKASNLGELKYHFPNQVADGIVIPFGVFRQLLNQEMETDGPTVFQWIQKQHKMIRAMPEGQARAKAEKRFLKKLSKWIRYADPGNQFRKKLKVKLRQVFGKNRSYSLFVRSDTNIEDLPNFTGAGLNLTVPNVKGFNKILDAISRVWASPFTNRAYSWRQKHMDKPEHVYVSILLMRTVPVNKSGVMVTMDVQTGDKNWLSIATNEGIGGVVSGQSAEELRVNVNTGKVRLISESTSTFRNVPNDGGGLKKVPVHGKKKILTKPELNQLLRLKKTLSKKFPLVDAQGKEVPVDVEFGFHNGNLALFQIRPYVRSKHAKKKSGK